MKTPTPSRTAEWLTFGLLVAFFAAFGWFALWQQEITLKGKSGATSVFTGSAAQAVSAAAFIVSAVVLALLLRSFSAGRRTSIAAFVVLLLPPAIYAVSRS